jgi:hypothetical protein
MTTVTADELTNVMDEIDFGDDKMIRLADQLKDILAHRRNIIERHASKGKSYAALLMLAAWRAARLG